MRPTWQVIISVLELRSIYVHTPQRVWNFTNRSGVWWNLECPWSPLVVVIGNSEPLLLTLLVLPLITKIVLYCNPIQPIDLRKPSALAVLLWYASWKRLELELQEIDQITHPVLYRTTDKSQSSGESTSSLISISWSSIIVPIIVCLQQNLGTTTRTHLRRRKTF